MGYTIGRKLNFQAISQIAKQFRSRSEFQKKDNSAYITARNNDWLDEVCKHMKNVAFSMPQLICKDILDSLLQKPSLYNTRKIIPPYEIDIYYDQLKLAIEYNGKGWHADTDAVKRDEIKKQLLKEKNIHLIVLKENNRDYEKDIKDQLLNNDYLINILKINKEDILNKKINWNKIYEKSTIKDRIKEIELKVNTCNGAKQFREIFPQDYRYIIKYKIKHLIETLKKQNNTFSKEEILRNAKEYTLYSDFTKSKYYKHALRKNILTEATKHMLRKKRDLSSIKALSNNELLNEIKNTKCEFLSDLKRNFYYLYKEAKLRDLKWTNNSKKIKNDPFEIKKQYEELINSGLTSGKIKKLYSKIYASYRFNLKKGVYNVKKEEKS